MTADKLNNSGDVKKFLRGLGLHVDANVVQQVVNVLSGKSDQSLYSLYATRKDIQLPVCGKGTVYKIKKLYGKGELKPYLAYLSDSPIVYTDGTEQGKEAEHEVQEEARIEHLESDCAITQQTQKLSANLDASYCMASPDNIDVNFLKKNRIPPKKAPKILFEWRYCHREGSHDKCCLYQNLIDDLTVKKITFERAEALLCLELQAKDLGSEIIQKDASLARIYRPWENKGNWEIWIKELQELRTPGPLKKQHLDEVTDLLRRFQEEVENTRAEQNWDIIFKVEQDPLFADMMDHCNEIQWDFDRIRLQRLKYEPIMKKLISTIAQESPAEANEDFTKFVVRYAANRPVHRKLPDYSINPHEGTAWRLTIQEGEKGTNIAIGSQERMEQCRVLHIDLISVYKRDLAIKKLRSVRRDILIHLKSLHEQISDTLTRQDYFYTLCSRCIQLRDE